MDRKMSTNGDVTEDDKVAPVTKRQLVILVFLCYGNFCNNACYSLIGPFYPKVAETKGKTIDLVLNVYIEILFDRLSNNGSNL